MSLQNDLLQFKYDQINIHEILEKYLIINISKNFVNDVERGIKGE